MAVDGKEHHVEGRFRNPWPSYSFEGSFTKFLGMLVNGRFDRKQMTPNAEVLAHLGTPLKTEFGRLLNPPTHSVQGTKIDNFLIRDTYFTMYVKAAHLDGGNVFCPVSQATWVGHATFLVQFDGLNVLTDPVWSDRCSPSQLLGPKRFVPVPFPLKDLPPVDAVIISHNHYDHLDERTVKELGNKPLYLVPMGVKDWFTSRGITNVVELDWWQEHRVSFPDGDREKSLRAICTPCQHFSGRGVLDRNKTLWCSWVLEGQTKKVYFAGDTGFCTVPRDCSHPGGFPSVEVDPTAVISNLPVCPAFEEIGKRFGPIDISFIPIGAYSPRYFMSSIHCSPEDAVGIHLAVGSKQSVGMHWGTFALTDEPIMEPPRRLLKELERLKIDPSKFITMKHGDTKAF